jgi:hypothetical protein
VVGSTEFIVLKTRQSETLTMVGSTSMSTEFIVLKTRQSETHSGGVHRVYSVKD